MAEVWTNIKDTYDYLFVQLAGKIQMQFFKGDFKGGKCFDHVWVAIINRFGGELILFLFNFSTAFVKSSLNDYDDS